MFRIGRSFECLHNYFISQGDLILGGDFNCVDNALDKFHSNDVPSSDKNCLCSLKSDFSLVDVWRKQNGHGVSFTWSNSNHTQASRLDRFLISKSLLQRICSNTVFPCVFSDHDFINLEMNLHGSSNRRSTLWKFNCSLLSDPHFIIFMTDILDKQKLDIEKFNSFGEWWDNLKIVIRNACIDFSVRKHSQVNAKRNFLTKKLIWAKNALHSGDVDFASIVKNLECALSSLLSKEAEGAKIRSKAQWIEEGEKPTQFFFRLEHKRAGQNCFDSN